MTDSEFYRVLDQSLIPKLLEDIEASGISAKNAECISSYLANAVTECNKRALEISKFKAVTPGPA